ncbi:MAG: GDP-mannose 4,6-dehydratase [Acidimicrobiales bacterium]
MRVLVTGSKGFVGGWLIAELESRGDSVIGLDAEVDVTDAALLTESVTGAAPDAICHLAARASVGTSWSDPAGTFSVNTLGTVNVLGAALECRPRPRVLLVSSSEVYGTVAPVDLPIGEDRRFAPRSPYAASKAAAEMAGLQAWLGPGLEVVRARPFNHTGAGQRTDFVVPALARQVVEAARGDRGALETGNLDARRDITDVRDVARAYRDLLEAGDPGTAYNVCRGESISIHDVAKRLLAIAGADLPIVVDPGRVREAEIPDLRGDPARLHGATGWRAEIGIDEMLAGVLDYWAGATS